MTRSLALIVAVVVALAGAAVAKPKIALTPIDGDENDELADTLEAVIDGSDLDVTGTRSTARTLDKLGYDTDLDEKQAKKVSEALEVDAILVGELDQKGVNKVLKFRMFVRSKKVRGFKVIFNNARSDRFKVMLREKLVEKIDSAKEETKKDKDDDEADDDKKTAKQDKKGKKGKKGKKRKGLGDDEDGDDDDEDEGDDDDDEDEDDDEAASRRRKRDKHTANRVAVRVDVGVSVQNRTLDFTSRKNNFPQAPNPYKNSPVPGARVEGELYPLAFGRPKSLAAGLGFAGAFDRTISLTLSTSEEPGVAIKATQQQWFLGGRFRIPFGSSPMAPSLTLAGDYGVRTFTMDRSGLMDPANLDVPDTRYKFVAGGLGFRFPLARPAALILGGRALGLLDAGPISRPSQYGQAKVFGGQAYAGLDIVIRDRFAIRLIGEFSQFGFAFVGNGALSNSRDQDPDTKDVGGAQDRSIGGAATLGVLY